MRDGSGDPAGDSGEAGPHLRRGDVRGRGQRDDGDQRGAVAAVPEHALDLLVGDVALAARHGILGAQCTGGRAGRDDAGDGDGQPEQGDQAAVPECESGEVDHAVRPPRGGRFNSTEATLGAGSRARNAPREEHRRPPAGGRGSSCGATRRRPAGVTLGVRCTPRTRARGQLATWSSRWSRSRSRWGCSRTATARHAASTCPASRWPPSPACRWSPTGARLWASSPSPPRPAPPSTPSAIRPARRSGRRSRSSTWRTTIAPARKSAAPRQSSSACSPSTSARRRSPTAASRRRRSCSGSSSGARPGASATGCAAAAGAGPTWPSGPPGPSMTPPASAGSPPPRSAPGSPATCTTRPPTRST